MMTSACSVVLRIVGDFSFFGLFSRVCFIVVNFLNVIFKHLKNNTEIRWFHVYGAMKNTIRFIGLMAGEKFRSERKVRFRPHFAMYGKLVEVWWCHSDCVSALIANPTQEFRFLIFKFEIFHSRCMIIVFIYFCMPGVQAVKLNACFPTKLRLEFLKTATQFINRKHVSHSV